MKYASNNIRNILIAGHAGSGKTTLTEALVYFSGAAERMGRVEDGTTISDFDPEEAKRKASLSASVGPVEYEGIKYNLIDAPGLFDFEAGEYEGIRAAESVLVVVSGRSGVTVGAEKAFQLARKNGKATMVFVSKCDLENANYFKILEDMKIKFGSTVCPCVVPAKLDDGTPVYINLFSQKAFKYEGGKQIQVDLPDIGHRFQGLIEAMSEAIAETDDELMEKFFGGEAFTTEEIVEGMRKGVKDGLITPVFCGSAVNQQALDMLLFNMHKLLPSPEHEASTLAEDAAGEPVELHCTVDEPTAAYVFKTVADPFVGKLSYLRVVSGKVTAGGEADHRDRVGIAMPFVGMRTNPPHRFSRFQQRDREDGRFHGIAQHERVEAGCKELHGDWFGFAVGRHFVAAAGNHQHGRALAIRVDFAAVVKAVADERGRAAVDSGNFIFKITHDSMLSMACPKSC